METSGARHSITFVMRLLEAWAELLRARITLRCRPAATVRAALQLAPRAPRAAAPEPGVLDAFAHAARAPWLATTCLPRAIALKRMLVRRGHDARLRIGLSRTSPSRGHAWVMLDDDVVLDDPSVAETYGLVLRVETLAAFPFVSPARIDFGKTVYSPPPYAPTQETVFAESEQAG
jgi:hypothetical protein